MDKHANIALPPQIVLGKDVLELVSSAMYVNPLTIFREYIQNAADSIDVARAMGVLTDSDPGRVDVTLDLNPSNRLITIRDNGVGVANGDFAECLTAIGGSRKRGSPARGFRGVGRLAGLGYCQELVFRSRSTNDCTVQELRWDCRLLKKLLHDHTYDGNLHDLVQEVAVIRELDGDGWPEHFYDVELIKPIRVKNDLLLNRDVIALYLSQVGPIPFSPNFRFGEQIRQYLVEHLGQLGEVNIYIDGAKEPLYRPYRDDYAYGEEKREAFTRPEFRVIEGLHGGTAAVAWLLHHGYHGVIPSGEGMNGLRARKGNLQVGDHRIFADVFPEARFANWTVGEVHVVDEGVMPNGRRDDFEHNAHYVHLLSRLGEIGDQIGRQCRTSSMVRNRRKTFETFAVKIDEQLIVLEQRVLGKAMTETVAADVRSKLFEVKRLTESGALVEADRATLKERYEALENRFDRAQKNCATLDQLKYLPKAERVVVQRMIALVYECSTNRLAAKSLVDRMLARLGEG